MATPSTKGGKETGTRPLQGRVAVVAGGSRGAGRGIARALGEAGATVYVSGRTTRQGPRPADGAPGDIDTTAEEVTAAGGSGIPVRTDHTAEKDVAALFERVVAEQGRLDLLVNAVWGAADAVITRGDLDALWGKPFWEQSPSLWQNMMTAGPYAYLLASTHAARHMVAHGGGLIVGVTDGVVEGAPADAYGGQLLWELAHSCINQLLFGMSVEGKPKKIAVVTLMPGFMQTERVLMHLKTEADRKRFGFDRSESTQYIGRAVAALAADPKVLEKTGKIHFVADLAREYGFTDVDGRQIPRFNPFA
jgi:NAD(P)-dependent dehydrogenase (short-subunit alcohol dehydrogenase family)